MMSGLRTTQEMQEVSGLELMDVMKKGEERGGMVDEEKKPKINNMQEQENTTLVDQEKTKNGMEEIKFILHKIEEKIMGRIRSIEEKIEVLMKRMEPIWVSRGKDMDPVNSNSPDAKRFQANALKSIRGDGFKIEGDTRYRK